MIDGYTIGIRLSVTNTIFTQISELTRGFAKVNSEAKGIGGTLNSTGQAVSKLTSAVNNLKNAFKGVADTARSLQSAGSAIGGLYGLERAGQAILKPAFEQRSTEVDLKLSGATDAQIRQFSARAAEVAKTSGMKQNEIMQQMGNQFGVTREVDSTLASAKDWSDFYTANNSAEHPMTQEMMRDARRIVEARKKFLNPDGSYNQAGTQQELNYMATSMSMSHGAVNPSTLFAQTQRLGSSNVAAQSPGQFYGAGAEMSNAMGAHPAGTAMMSLMTQLKTGIMPLYVLRELIRDGIIHPRDKNGKALIRMEGRHAVLLPGAVDNKEALQSSPYSYMYNHIENAKKIRQAADPTHRTYSDDDIISGASGRQTGQRGAGEIMAIFQLMQRYEQNLEKLVAGRSLSDVADTRRNEDPNANMRSFTSAWNDLLAALGTAILPDVTGYIKSFTTTLREWGDWAKEHPEDMKRIQEFLASGAVIGIGIVGLAGGLALLGKSIALFAIGSAAMGAIEAMTGEKGFAALAAGLTKLFNVFDSIPVWLKDALTGAITGATVGSIIPGIGTVAGGAIGAITKVALGGISDKMGLFLTPEQKAERQKSEASKADKLRATMMPLPQMPSGTGGGDAMSRLLNMGISPGSGGSQRAPGDIQDELDRMGAAGPPPARSQKHSSYAPTGGVPVQMASTTILTLDGEVVNRSVQRSMVRQGRLPLSGYSGFDGSRTPNSPGAPMAA